MDFGLFVTTDGQVDMQVRDGDIGPDNTLQTAVILSLLTDRRAHPDDDLPESGGDLRGWWADTFFDRPVGSRLWLLSREKEAAEVRRRAEHYAREALEWLVEDGAARKLGVEAVHVRRGVLGLKIRIHKPDGSSEEMMFEYAWEAMEA
ncbi:phage GP46 family protein [Desulfonatronovibrio hydrogenovorans]|uniref:phage GP46 family protein n=1 Tax=Desulfonatronovibrio hydrogenovorans TaxID=53245 RepID=UPI0006922430|nr:phage GP46 family protein [Desulfonatronovibrio hydrogenovorans]